MRPIIPNKSRSTTIGTYLVRLYIVIIYDSVNKNGIGIVVLALEDDIATLTAIKTQHSYVICKSLWFFLYSELQYLYCDKGSIVFYADKLLIILNLF